MEFKHNLGPYLVIVPLSTLSNWQNEFIKWCPSARLVCYKGTPAVRKELYKDQVSKGHFNVLLTTYEYIIKDKKFLRKIDWTYAIVDEGHRMKNAQSKFAVTLGTHYNTEYRVLLTGTPLMNQLSELWSLLNFLLPTIFNSVETFDQWFSRPFSQFGTSSAGKDATQESEAEQFLSNEERMLIIHRLHELLRPFMLRRVKSEVLDQLPEKVEKVLRCELSSWQKELYKQISVKAVESNQAFFSDSFVQQAQTPSRGLNNIVMQLRKVCNHPMLFTPEGYQINEQLIRSSGKVALLDQMLPKLKAAGHRVLIFTQMTAVMTILEDYFAYRGYLSLRLDGSTPAEEREKRMYKFNAPDSPYFIFLLSTRAGGLGLNLTAADTVIIFDSDWNPMMDLQAQGTSRAGGYLIWILMVGLFFSYALHLSFPSDRAHRIGQRSDVSVFRLITNSPVEEKILSRATEKLNISELVVEAGKFNKGSVESDNSLERKQMMEILLTDFDTSTHAPIPKGPSEKSGGSDNGDDDDNGSDSSDEEDLNELLSNNEIDYQMYAEFDAQRERDGIPLAELYTDPDGIPDWIRYPSGKKPEANDSLQENWDGSRKRKAVTYDDGLTEKQFIRLMEKQAIEDENKASARKKARKSKQAGGGGAAASDAGDDANGLAAGKTGSELTDWTFRKLISCTKSVVALKDPSTKRKLSELFLEKPAPQQFPDYLRIDRKAYCHQ
jgi:ATP-dependent helicase STH1/SNF2